jgi:hypothetical protein
MNIEELWTSTYREKRISDHMTIAEVMKTVSYEETEKSVVNVPIFSEELEEQMRRMYESFGEDLSTVKFTHKTTIVDQILASMIKNAGVYNFGTIELKVDKLNPIWIATIALS